MMPTLLWVAIAVLVLNLPFGYLRAGFRRYGLAWFLAVHVPVPLVVGLRILSRLGWQPITFPILIGAYLAGQFAGGRLRAWHDRSS